MEFESTEAKWVAQIEERLHALEKAQAQADARSGTSDVKDCWGRVVFTTAAKLNREDTRAIIIQLGEALLHVDRSDRGDFCWSSHKKHGDLFCKCLEFVLSRENDVQDVERIVNGVLEIHECRYQLCHHGIWQICVDQSRDGISMVRTNGVVQVDNIGRYINHVDNGEYMYDHLEHVGMPHDELVGKMMADGIRFWNEEADIMREYILEWDPIKKQLDDLQQKVTALEEKLSAASSALV